MYFFLANHLVGYLLICKLTESQIMMYFLLFYLKNFVLFVYVIFYSRWVGSCPFPLLFYHKHLIVLNFGLWMCSYAIETIFLYLLCSSSNIYCCSCSYKMLSLFHCLLLRVTVSDQGFWFTCSLIYVSSMPHRLMLLSIYHYLETY